MFYLVPLTIKYTGGLEGQDFSHSLKRGVLANNETDAKRSVLVAECDLLDADIIDEVCAVNNYSLLDEDSMNAAHDITVAKHEAGEEVTVVYAEDERLAYKNADPIELQLIDATVGGVDQKIYVPMDTSLLKTRMQLNAAGKLATDDNQLYCVEVNLYIGSSAQEPVDKYFETHTWAKDKEAAKFNAMLNVCQETTLEDTLTRVDSNGIWDTCDDSGAYTAEAVYQMLETDVTIGGKDYVVFVAENTDIFDAFTNQDEIGYMGDHKIAQWDV